MEKVIQQIVIEIMKERSGSIRRSLQGWEDYLRAALLPYAERVIESEDGGNTARKALAKEGK